MILVDSSVWIDFFRARLTPQTIFLRDRLGAEEFVTGDLVLAEVLQGALNDRMFAFMHDLLTQLPVIQIVDANVAVEAARHYRFLRVQGITIRKTIDTLIATRCITDRFSLLHADRDFDPFVAHLGLISALRPTTGVN